jgi:hypothetical protein
MSTIGCSLLMLLLGLGEDNLLELFTDEVSGKSTNDPQSCGLRALSGVELTRNSSGTFSPQFEHCDHLSNLKVAEHFLHVYLFDVVMQTI